MQYYKTIQLKDGRACCLRNAKEADSAAALANFILTHEQTDYLLTYPDENTMTAEDESRFLKAKTESLICLMKQNMNLTGCLRCRILRQVVCITKSHAAHFRVK